MAYRPNELPYFTYRILLFYSRLSLRAGNEGSNVYVHFRNCKCCKIVHQQTTDDHTIIKCTYYDQLPSQHDCYNVSNNSSNVNSWNHYEQLNSELLVAALTLGFLAYRCIAYSVFSAFIFLSFFNLCIYLSICLLLLHHCV